MKKIFIIFAVMLFISCAPAEQSKFSEQRVSEGIRFEYEKMSNLVPGEFIKENGISVVRVKKGYIFITNSGTIYIPEENF